MAKVRQTRALLKMIARESWESGKPEATFLLISEQIENGVGIGGVEMTSDPLISLAISLMDFG